MKAGERIIVIGASAGGVEALKQLVKDLPADFATPIFIVWHMASEVRGVLPRTLSMMNSIYAAHAFEGEAIKPNRIYIAPPDHHMLIGKDVVRVTHGPKENRFRPAVDPLFRSAAYEYGNRVIGIILSGALDDGTAGLWSIKHYGGTAIVQDPADAEVASMPENALREVGADYCVKIADMAKLLVDLVKTVPSVMETERDQQTKREIEIAGNANALEKNIFEFGELTPYTCPECHGVLTRLHNGGIVRYRCHTGHAYSADSLIEALTERTEDNLYKAVCSMDESVLLLNHIGDHFAEINNPQLAAIYFKKAKETAEHSDMIRKAIQSHEGLNSDILRWESGNEGLYTEK